MSFSDQVYKLVAKIPRGRVMTYGQIASALNKPGASRAVGNALHKNPFMPDQVPCHRVVNRLGQVSANFGLGGPAVQKQRLEQEGVAVKQDHSVDLKKYLHL